MAAVMADYEHDVENDQDLELDHATRRDSEEEQYETERHESVVEVIEKHRLGRTTSKRSIHTIRRSISRSTSRTNVRDAEREYRVRGGDLNNGGSQDTPPLTLTKTESANFVFFSDNDPDNPYNWGQGWKIFYVFIGIISVLNSTLSSALPSADIPKLAEHYHVTQQIQLVLPNSIYLVGYVFGPLIFAPLSESYGRQIVMNATFVCYTLSTLGTCLAPTWAGFLVLRLLAGCFASSPISVTGGIFADLYNNPISRGRSMAMFMTATTWGPIISPVASGYLGVYGYRWPYWFALIFAGVSLVLLVFLPETYGPVILQRRARKIRKQNPGMNVWAPIDYEKSSVQELVKIFLGRPFRMLFFECLVYLSCIYLALAYSIFYIFLQAYPIIFPPIYGFTLGEQGLAFLPIGVGAIFACGIYLWWDDKLIKAKKANKPWAEQEEYRRLPLACLGGPFMAVGIFWIGWAARSDVHWIVPMLGGLPYGVGFLLLFMALINYMVDAYQVFAASALAAASASRSLFGAVLPFAARRMYETLGVGWACSLLGFVMAAMCLIPFGFIKWGDRIRANSSFCQELAERQKQKEEQELRRRRRQEQRQAAMQHDEKIV